MDDLIPRSIAVVAGTFVITFVVLIVGTLVTRAAALRARQEASQSKDDVSHD